MKIVLQSLLVLAALLPSALGAPKKASMVIGVVVDNGGFAPPTEPGAKCEEKEHEVIGEVLNKALAQSVPEWTVDITGGDSRRGLRAKKRNLPWFCDYYCEHVKRKCGQY